MATIYYSLIRHYSLRSIHYYSFYCQHWDWYWGIPRNEFVNVLGLKTNSTELSLNKTTRLAIKRSHVARGMASCIPAAWVRVKTRLKANHRAVHNCSNPGVLHLQTQNSISWRAAKRSIAGEFSEEQHSWWSNSWDLAKIMFMFQNKNVLAKQSDYMFSHTCPCPWNYCLTTGIGASQPALGHLRH